MTSHRGPTTVGLPLGSAPARTVPETLVFEGNGEFLGSGTTAIVERLPSGDVIKSPIPGRNRGATRRKELATEARIYERLGKDPRVVSFKSWDPETYTLTLEYMANGTLKDYISSHAHEISWAQKLIWAIQAADAIRFLHSSGIIQCDVGPHNFLLHADLSLKVADFGGSSMDGSVATVCAGSRYAMPDPDWKFGNPPSVSEDIFALGSTIYFIFSGKQPFEGLSDDIVEQNYLAGIFPNLVDVPYSQVIESCWRQEILSAEELYNGLVKLDQQYRAFSR